MVLFIFQKMPPQICYINRHTQSGMSPLCYNVHHKSLSGQLGCVSLSPPPALAPLLAPAS